MAGGAGAGSFGGGFAGGLSQVLLGHRASEDKKRADEEARKDRLFQTMLPIYLENVESPADLEPLFADRFPDLMGPKGKGKKGQPGAFDTISHFLSPLIGQTGRMAAGTPQQSETTVTPTAGGAPESMAWPAAGGELQPAPAPAVVDPHAASLLGQPAMPAAGVPAAAAPAPAAVQRRTLMGVPVMSEEEKIAQSANREGKTAEARVAVARRLLPQLKAIDPTFTLEDALRYISKGDLYRDPTSGTAANQSIAGEMPDGTAAFGVFNRASGTYTDAETGEPLKGFRPRTTTGSSSSGADRDAIAQADFGKKFALLTQAQQQAVQAKLPQFAGTMAEARGLGTGRAKTATELAAPIGPTAAALYNVPPTTSLAELSQTNTLRPDQQDKVAAFGQIDELLNTIAETLPKVYPDVEPGIWGRLQTQWALATKRLAADEDLATMDAATNAVLAQVAQLSGQPGSRLSDRDIELAKSTLTELKPKLFDGDVRRTALARLGVLNRLLEKAKGAVPPKTALPGGGTPGRTPGIVPGAGVPNGTPGGPGTTGAVIKDGKLYVNGVEIGGV